MFDFSAILTSAAAGLVLPIIVALITRPSTSSDLKGSLHGILAGFTGGYAMLFNHPDHTPYVPMLFAFLAALLSGKVFYYAGLKKYAWFAVVQNALVREAADRLHISPEDAKTLNAAVKAANTDETQRTT